MWTGGIEGSSLRLNWFCISMVSSASQLVAAVVDHMPQPVQLLVQTILRYFLFGSRHHRPALCGRFRKLEFLRLHAGQLGQACAQRIQALHLRLHLTDPDRHRIQAVLQIYPLLLLFVVLHL